ncbi:hypothetical protein MXB_3820, partial [Myxobolus squamalis]
MVRNDFAKMSLGISSRNRKIFSKPMLEILYRLCACHFLDIIIIPDNIVRKYEVEKWPIVNIFLCFYAKGYPLDKAIKYVELRKPYVINEIYNQKVLFNRREIYRVLSHHNVCVPNFMAIERDSISLQPLSGEVIEDGDVISYNGKKMTKPFVEKPFDAENHNITIYFPNSIGGGCQKLFRKMGNRSSFYCKEGEIRRNGSYIYEDFLLTDGADVKVYCVGPEYAHAEARKSPALDGKVERDYAGKEMRYPVILASSEKFIARKVVEIFQQNVCGIDMLRTGGKCYVCDVNGFSFVKKSVKYYDDCAHMMVEIILRHFYKNTPGIITNPLKNASNGGSKKGASLKKEHTLELVSVIAIIRHGDRTPKQKMKMLTRHPEFFKIFKKYGGDEEARVKLKKPSQLQDILDVTNHLIKTNTTKRSYEAIDNPAKLLQMKYVLEMYGEFMGFNRKVQIKSLDDKRNKILECKFRAHHPEAREVIDFSERSLLLILKWGGELTEVGRIEAEEFGQRFANLYPKNDQASLTTSKFLKNSRFSKGLLRLHSTYRHNMKVFSSNEGRVELTAAAFARGMLFLESQLAPILVHLVVSDDKTTQMLDSSNQCKRIHELISLVHDAVVRIFDIKIYSRYLTPDAVANSSNFTLCHGETPDLMERRWGKLNKDFKMKNNIFDMSLIPDIYDCARYDYFHNRKLDIDFLPELYERSTRFAHVIISQEYGITPEEKLSIGKDVCNKLINKISADLKHNLNFYDDEGHILDAEAESSVSTPHRRVRTRLYFTSESHIYGLMNIFRYGGLFESAKNDQDSIFSQNKHAHHIDNIPELDFLSHFLIMQYEDCLMDKNDDNRFKVEIFFSPGNKRDEPITKNIQLTRPSLSKSHIRSRSFLEFSKTPLSSSKDDISPKSIISDDDKGASDCESIKFDSFPKSSQDFESIATASDTQISQTTIFNEAINQLRKP